MARGVTGIPDPVGLMTNNCTSITVGSSDFQMSTYFNSGVARQIVPQAAGNVFIQRPGDDPTVWTKYVVLASVPINGLVSAISGQTSNATATAMAIVLEF